MAPFTVNDATATRARLVADELISAGDTMIANGLRAPAENYKMVVGAYGWWRLVNRTSRAVLVLVDQGFSAPECLFLMKP